MAAQSNGALKEIGSYQSVMMELYQLLLLLFLAVIRAAGLTSGPPSFFERLDNTTVLKYAKLCQAVKLMGGSQTNETMTHILRDKGLIGLDAEVLVHSYRNIPKDISSLVVMVGVNHFLMVCIGTKTAMGVLSMFTLDQESDSLYDTVINAMDYMIPEFIDVQLSDKQRGEGPASHIDAIKCQIGFPWANQNLFMTLFKGLQPYYVPNVPVVFEITGHSIGGALAAHAAYHVMKYLPGQFEIASDWVSVEVVLFGAAGGFTNCPLRDVSEKIRAMKSMVTFNRPEDYARAMTKIVGWANPGYHISLENFVAARVSLDDYLSKLTWRKEFLGGISAELDAEIENSDMSNYVRAIEAGIGGQQTTEAPK